jgi:hypothetical protein
LVKGFLVLSARRFSFFPTCEVFWFFNKEGITVRVDELWSEDEPL